MTKGWTGFDLPDESEEVILFYDFNDPGYYKSHTTEDLNFISDYGIFCAQVRFRIFLSRSFVNDIKNLNLGRIKPITVRFLRK